MVVGEPSIHNIMGGMESTGGVRLHNHKRKLKQRFDIIKKLGQGTYGKVQLGINKETGQEVAIKTIKKCKIETEADLIRIRREIQIMSSVQHPNIIHIYEVFENREKMVLVMEYAAGGELYDYLSERKVLAEEEARRIFRQISIAVFYCHKHKICHRDLKLENILLDQAGNAKIADFGLSNVFDDRRLLNTFCGSPLYASPEIVKGTPYHGPEVDCWSLGVLLYTLVYGAMPFDGSNFKRLTRQISASDYFEPKNPSPASPLIKDMLLKCPTRRADIERICCHWWVNEGYQQNCLEIAEDLAAQTPVRLDLLLSLVPQSASADKLVVGDGPRPTEAPVSSLSSDNLVPTRCHSVGSLMELDRSSDKLREIVEGMETTEGSERPEKSENKRKLEMTPSMEETISTGTKKKERNGTSRQLEEREPRAYKSASRHHSAPIEPVAIITEEPMDLRDPERADAILELLKEAQEHTKERSKTPVGKIEGSAGSPEIQPAHNAEGEKPKKRMEKKEGSDEAIGGCVEENNLVSLENESQNKEKSLRKASIDGEENSVAPAKPTERRRSKIFETAEKFNQLASSATTEPEKAKKIFIPGVNVGGAKRAFERKASLSSIPPCSSVKRNTSKVILDAPKREETANSEDMPASKVPTTDEEERKRDEDKKRAVDIISGALGKPPIKKSLNGSPPLTPQSSDPKKLGIKIQLGPNDVRNATVSVTTPVDEKYPDYEVTPRTLADKAPEPVTMSSKMEITLKSATLPRPRKTSKAEIILAGFKPPYKSQVEAKIDAFQPQKLRTQRSEVAFPVAAVLPQANRSASLEPEKSEKVEKLESIRPGKHSKERIIPIEVEPGQQSPPSPLESHAKPPMPQRSFSQRSGSLSRQSTADSDTDSALGSTLGGPEPIRKSPREYIIPIAVEGGGYVTPRSASLEPESKNSTPTSVNPPRSKFSRPRRMGSLLSDASEDESPFSTLHRDSDDLLQRHMHRLRSSRPLKQSPEHADSLSSGEEDDDDDGFELLTAENLFSTLLSRVRSLTQRLNVDDHRGGGGFPRSRLLERMGSNSSQGFWGLHEPLSRRLAETPFRRSMSRDNDRFARKDSAMSSNPGTPNSLGRSTPSRESMFDAGSSNTLPRDKCDDTELDLKMIKELQEEQDDDKKFTPCLARRLSRQFIEKTRLSLPRSPSIPRERSLRSSTEEPLSIGADPLELSYRSRSTDRSLRRAASLLDSDKHDKNDKRVTRRSVSLFEDDPLLPPLPRQVMTLGRRCREHKSPECSRRESRQMKIQEEAEVTNSPKKIDTLDTTFSTSEASSTTNMADVSSFSTRSGETSPTDLTSKIQEDSFSSFKAHAKDFENRLLAAENLIKESKMRNLGINKMDPNLTSSYRDTDKCDKELLGSMSDLTSSILSKRRSCIPSLRLRSGSLTREASMGGREGRDDSSATTPERSLLSKLFRSSSSTRESDKEKSSPKVRRKISRFLRPDFFDTPREESQYVKEKEAQKAAENERRKSRFMRRKVDDSSIEKTKDDKERELKQEKELKNQANTLTKEKIDESSSGKGNKIESASSLELQGERQSPKHSFLQSLERKLDKLRSSDESKGASASPEKEKAKGEAKNPVDVVDEICTPEVRKVASAEDIPKEQSPSSGAAKSKVSSVLGLFKNDAKSLVNGNKQSSTLLSKFRKNSYKGSRSDTSVVAEDTSASSKIPTKSKVESKSNPKVLKPNLEKKKSVDKAADIKKSPPKEKLKDKSPLKDKVTKEKTPTERASVEKKLIADKLIVKFPKKSSPDKSIESKSEKSCTDLISPQTSDKLDNKSCSNIRLCSTKKSPEKSLDNKKVDLKLPEKKKVLKSVTPAKNGLVSKVEKPESEKIKKVIIKKEIVERAGEDGTKKKKIVRVVKKVVKKSKSSDKKDEEEKANDKPLKSSSLKKIAVKKEPSPDIIVRETEVNLEASNSAMEGVKPSSQNDPIERSETEVIKSHQGLADPPGNVPHTSLNFPSQDLTSIDAKSRMNRSNLKLDLSKVPQHNFKPPSGLKRESPKSEPPVQIASPSTSELPDQKSTCASLKPEMSTQRKFPFQVSKASDLITNSPSNKHVPGAADPPELSKTHSQNLKARVSPKATQNPLDELLSPTEDCESFDSWSLCSNDLSRSSDFHSPTSPTYCPPGREQSESIIDRIRRKSFYSRFNERKRKTSLTCPSIGSSLASPLASSTLPRKFSFSSLTRDDSRIKGLASPTRRHDRPITMYNDDQGRFSKSPIDRYSQSDVGSFSGNTDLDHLRRYRLSPTPDPPRKYQSPDSTYHQGCKSPLSMTPYADYRGRDLTSNSSKYGLGGSGKSKSAEYYEQLLAPTVDYFTRRTPVSEPNNENGYTNGYIEMEDGDKWRTRERFESEESDKSLGMDDRGSNKLSTQVKELSAACPDTETTN